LAKKDADSKGHFDPFSTLTDFGLGTQKGSFWTIFRGPKKTLKKMKKIDQKKVKNKSVFIKK